METIGCRFNLSDVIKKIKETPPKEQIKQGKSLFPYLETYGLTSFEDNSFGRSLKYRETFIHNQTIKHSEPFFTCNRVFSRIEKKTPSIKSRKNNQSKQLIKSVKSS